MLAATASPRRVRGKPHPVRRRTSSSPYEPYGEVTATGASTNPYQYTGRENDGTGLYYYRARYYNPTLKRFISEDPLGLAAGLDSYAYVDGNPNDRKDPYGLQGFPVGCLFQNCGRYYPLPPPKVPNDCGCTLKTGVDYVWKEVRFKVAVYVTRWVVVEVAAPEFALPAVLISIPIIELVETWKTRYEMVAVPYEYYECLHECHQCEN